MIPHHKKESKLDATDNLAVINEIAEAKSCDTTVYFEARKKRDLYMWLSATPSGPSVRFHVVNAHTMDELRLTGNCLKGSRPILSFDRSFDDEEGAPHLRLMRELLGRAFAPPRTHPKVQPFHDRVINFGYADGKVWFRHFQVVDKAVDAKDVARMLTAGEQPTVLVEVGPRFVLDPVRVFAGSFGGATLWINPEYVSPNAARRALASTKADKYTSRTAAVSERKERETTLVLPHDPLEDVFKSGAGAAAAAAGGAGAAEGSGDEDDEDEEGSEDEDEEGEGEGSEEDEEEGEFSDDDEGEEEEDDEDEDEEEEEEPPAPVKGKGKTAASAGKHAPAPAAAAPAAKRSRGADGSSAAAAPPASAKGRSGRK